MPITDYGECKIYKLVSSQTDKVYIGSTCQKQLSRRLGQHKTYYKNYLNGKNIYLSSYEILKYPDAKIILVQSYPQCQNNMEKCMYEQDWIDCYDCVNKRKAYISPELVKEQRAEYKKEYYKINKEQILAGKREKKVLCECGRVVAHSILSKHKTTQIHKKYLNNSKEQILEKSKERGEEKVLCDCGRKIARWGLSKHKKTQIHQDYLNNR